MNSTEHSNASAVTTAFKNLRILPLTERMPVLFIGHGNPMNAIEDNSFTRMWREVAQRIPTPQAIIVMSAHWVTTNGTFVTAVREPQTIHDFYGFPPELYTQKYPAPGNPVLAQELCSLSTSLLLDHEWGLDHGAWSVLKQMYPDARIPVLQLSVNFSLSPLQEYELVQQLHELRNHGILFLGSGNIVHNLGAMKWDGTPYEWAQEFDILSRDLIAKRDIHSLAHYEALGRAAQLSVPTSEHYRPMLSTLALSNSHDSLTFFNEDLVLGSVGMRSFMLTES